MTDVLSDRVLNRTLLARQHLLQRAEVPVVDAVERLVGMQSQAPQAPYVGLWSRVAGFDPAELSDRMVDRSVVRIALMRGTVHLVSAPDALLLRPLVQVLYDRFLTMNAPLGREMANLDLAKLAAVGRELVEETPRTNGELRSLLAAKWPDQDPARLAQALRFLLPCVQVPPRGLWKGSGQATVTTAEAWIGRPLHPDPSLEDLVNRYLAGYGPASVADMQAWSGLTRLGETVARMTLQTYTSPSGQTLYDLPTAKLASGDEVAPVRFLPEYDNCLRGHLDRTRVMSDPTRAALFNTKNDAPRPAFLVDGYVRGTWRVTQTRTRAEMVLEPFGRALSKRHESAVTTEARRLLAFLAPDAEAVVRPAD